jgi:hypothetical protein
MVPFEPKTDSKEFEIANPEQSPATGTRIAASAAADVTIRVWRRGGGGDTAALNWQSESVLVYMIADLVAASHGCTAVEMPATMAAHFDNSLHALVAAKRIENAILEFLACRPGDYTGAAVLIHPPVAAGFSQGMAQSALRLAEPGQVILSEEVSRRFQDLPGIELRAVPALTTGGTEHAGLAELIWTSPERLASLRNSTNVAPTTSEVGPPVGATMIVNSPFATPRSNTTSGSDRIDTAAEGFKNPEGVFEEGLAEFEERRSFITGSKMVVGAVAIVLVIVALALFHPWSGSRVQPKSQVVDETPAGTVPATTTEAPASSIPQPRAVQPPPEQPVKVQPPRAKPPVTIKTPTEKNEKDKAKKPEDTPIQGFEGNSTYDGMTQRDIPRLLQWARSDAGNGNYAKAAQEYRVILQLQPYNSDAKEGLRKIQVAQQRDQ